MSRKVLIVSESDDEHAAVISNRMTQRSLEWSWLQTDKFSEQKQAWSIDSLNDRMDCSWVSQSIGSIWYRKRYTLPLTTQDSIAAFVQQEEDGLLNSILLQYKHCRWVSRLESLVAARPKINQLVVARRMGFQVPDTIVTNDVARLHEFHVRHKGEVVAKPIQTQVVKTNEGSLVVGTRYLPFHAIPASVSATSCYAQERLVIEAEIRVIVFGMLTFAFRMVPRVKVDDLKQLGLQEIDHSPYLLDSDLQSQICTLVK